MKQLLAAPASELSHDPSTSDNVSREDAWRRNYGSAWRLELAFLGLVWFLIAALRPLNDPDLPIHLATGEWIVRHWAVPVTEPFAWTRPGAPYYAYSWAIDVVFYLFVLTFGPLGLRVLDGLIMVGVGCALLFLGRTAHWHPRVTVLMINVGLAIAAFTSTLRPQLLLLILVPLAWGLMYRVIVAERVRWPALGLVTVNAAAANTHIFFPLMAAAWALLFLSPPRDRQWARLWIAVGATLAGWMLSPYALMWPAVFRFTFTPNALLTFPTPIDELAPGFSAILLGDDWLKLIPALALTLLPWALVRVRMDRKQRIAAAGLWLAGLLGFAISVRLLMVWWLLVIPLAAAALAPLGQDVKGEAPQRKVKIAFAVLMLVAVGSLIPLALTARQIEGSVGSRRLPSYADAWTAPLADWLEAHTSPAAGGRIFTVFDFGSYLTWRLPTYSSSIDARGGIFPDSVARPEAYQLPAYTPVSVGPWRSADLAILPFLHRQAAVLDTAAGWRRVAYITGGREPFDSVGLWVKEAWWDEVGRRPLPDAAVELRTDGNTGAARPSKP